MERRYGRITITSTQATDLPDAVRHLRSVFSALDRNPRRSLSQDGRRNSEVAVSGVGAVAQTEDALATTSDLTNPLVPFTFLGKHIFLTKSFLTCPIVGCLPESGKPLLVGYERNKEGQISHVVIAGEEGIVLFSAWIRPEEMPTTRGQDGAGASLSPFTSPTRRDSQPKALMTMTDFCLFLGLYLCRNQPELIGFEMFKFLE